MEEIGIFLLFAGVSGLVLSMLMLGRRKVSRRPLDNFDFFDRKDSENRR